MDISDTVKGIAEEEGKIPIALTLKAREYDPQKTVSDPPPNPKFGKPDFKLNFANKSHEVKTDKFEDYSVVPVRKRTPARCDEKDKMIANDISSRAATIIYNAVTKKNREGKAVKTIVQSRNSPICNKQNP